MSDMIRGEEITKGEFREKKYTAEHIMHLLRMIIESGNEQHSAAHLMRQKTFQIAKDLGIPNRFLMVDDRRLEQEIKNMREKGGDNE